MDKKPITFSSTGRLEPIGELKVHEASCKVHPGGVSPKVIWIDEAGLLWNIAHPTTFWELKPVEWPKDIRANYVIGYDTFTGHGGISPITADSYQEALVQLKAWAKEKGIWLKEDTIHLKSVAAPFPFHEFDKKLVEKEKSA